MFRRIALALSLFLAAPLPAQSQSPVKVALEPEVGRIVVELDPVRAPVTTANVLAYVDGGRLDGETFYRAMRIGDAGLWFTRPAFHRSAPVAALKAASDWPGPPTATMSIPLWSSGLAA